MCSYTFHNAWFWVFPYFPSVWPVLLRFWGGCVCAQTSGCICTHTDALSSRPSSASGHRDKTRAQRPPLTSPALHEMPKLKSKKGFHISSAFWYSWKSISLLQPSDLANPTHPLQGRSFLGHNMILLCILDELGAKQNRKGKNPPVLQLSLEKIMTRNSFPGKRGKWFSPSQRREPPQALSVPVVKHCSGFIVVHQHFKPGLAQENLNLECLTVLFNFLFYF